MSPERLLDYARIIYENGGPRVRAVTMNPICLDRMTAKLTTAMRVEAAPLFPTMSVDGIEMRSDPWVPEGYLWFDPPESMQYLRCMIHDDCREHPNLGIACLAQSLAGPT